MKISNLGAVTAYAFAKKNGFEGTEAEWLASLKGDKGDKGDDGKTPVKGVDYTDGEDGKDGVGIASVQQTTTSTEDGGDNIITVTDTDGKASTFTVKNGSKGSKGDKGDPFTYEDFTEEQLNGIINGVLDAMPVAEEVSV